VTDVRLGFVEQNVSCKKLSVNNQSPSPVTRRPMWSATSSPGSLHRTLAGFKSGLVCWQVSVDAGGQLSVEAIGLAEQRALRFDSPDQSLLPEGFA